MAGKIMFREFAYITPDWSVRALDGYIIFRYLFTCFFNAMYAFINRR